MLQVRGKVTKIAVVATAGPSFVQDGVCAGNVCWETAFTTGSQQQNFASGIFGQTIGQYTTGLTGTDDDEVKWHSNVFGRRRDRS